MYENVDRLFYSMYEHLKEMKESQFKNKPKAIMHLNNK